MNIIVLLLHLDHRLEVPLSPLTRTSKLHGVLKVYYLQVKKATRVQN